MGLLLKTADPKHRPRMSSAEFMELYKEPWLRGYLVQSARIMAKRNHELFEDLLQEAWLRIDLNRAGLRLEYYAHEGFRGMQAYFKKEVRQWRLTKSKWCADLAFRRARNVTKRFFKKRSPRG